MYMKNTHVHNSCFIKVMSLHSQPLSVCTKYGKKNSKYVFVIVTSTFNNYIHIIVY